MRATTPPPADPRNDLQGPVSGHLVRKLTADVVGTAEPFTTIAPFTGKPLARLPQSNAEDVKAAFSRARTAQKAWSLLPVKERVKPFLKLYAMLLDRQEEILDLLQLETGKARLHAFEEILDGAGSTLYYARNAPDILRDHRRTGALPIATQTVEISRPLGVVTTITPWNYPFALSMDVVPALLAGNAVVQKPDTQTALSSLWPRSLLIEAGLPPEIWQVVLGDPEAIGDALIDNADFVAFTGSTTAGRRIAVRAAARLIGSSLELGGKNPMLVLADANIDGCAATAIRACFANAGQLCVAIERIYVHESRYPEFVRKFAALVGDLKLGAGLTYGTDIGSLTSARQLERVTDHVRDAIDSGATLVAGGHPRPEIGPYFFEPTVLIDVPDEALLCRQETFGPVVAVAPFATEEEAITLANDTEYGLNASVFGGNVAHARTVAAQIQAGTVNINEGYAATYASQDAPMGGMKQSGLGRRHGPGGLTKFVEQQTISAQHLMGFDPSFGLSSEQHTTLFTAAMRAMKALRIR